MCKENTETEYTLKLSDAFNGKSPIELIVKSYKYSIRECIENGILKDYLLREGSEVVNMLTAEYDYDTDIEVQREEAFAEGLEEGIEKGTNQINILNTKLIDAGRIDDLTASAKDPVLQKKLLEEFGLI